MSHWHGGRQPAARGATRRRNPLRPAPGGSATSPRGQREGLRAVAAARGRGAASRRQMSQCEQRELTHGPVGVLELADDRAHEGVCCRLASSARRGASSAPQKPTRPRHDALSLHPPPTTAINTPPPRTRITILLYNLLYRTSKLRVLGAREPDARPTQIVDRTTCCAQLAD